MATSGGSQRAHPQRALVLIEERMRTLPFENDWFPTHVTIDVYSKAPRRAGPIAHGSFASVEAARDYVRRCILPGEVWKIVKQVHTYGRTHAGDVLEKGCR